MAVSGLWFLVSGLWRFVVSGSVLSASSVDKSVRAGFGDFGNLKVF